MSHTVKVKSVNVTDVEALRAAVGRLNLPALKEGTHRLFDGTTRQGMALRLPNWRYDVVFDVASGEVLYDNYEGHWGQEIEIDRLVQAYTLEKSAAECRLQGFSEITEEVQENGDVHLTATAY